MSSQVPRVLCAAAVLGLALAGCGGGGDGVSLPSGRPGTSPPTLSAPAAPTASESDAARPTLPSSVTLPSVVLPTRTTVPPSPATTPAPPTTTAPRTTPPRTTAPPTTAAPPTTIAPPTTAAPPPATTVPATVTAPTSAVAAVTPTSALTPSPAAVPVAASSSPPAWVWWLLGLLIALVVAGLVLLAVRSRRARRAWEAQLAGVVDESTWLAHRLLPYALSAGMAAGRRDVWTAFRPRVHALVDNLTEVVASAPKDRMPTLDRLRAAVGAVRSAMDAYATSGPDERETLGAARQAQQQLEEALRAVQPPPSPSEPQL